MTMTKTDIELSEDAFAALFPLRTNYLNPGASWQNADGIGCLFETYGDEFEYVEHCDPRRIWTLVDDDDGSQSLLSGFHIVNRVGYLVGDELVPAGVAIRVRLDREPSGRLPANRRRAMKAKRVISDYGFGNVLEKMTDLLTDARHWCDEHEEDFAKLDRLAYRHYVAELNHTED